MILLILFNDLKSKSRSQLTGYTDTGDRCFFYTDTGDRRWFVHRCSRQTARCNTVSPELWPLASPGRLFLYSILGPEQLFLVPSDRAAPARRPQLLPCPVSRSPSLPGTGHWEGDSFVSKLISDREVKGGCFFFSLWTVSLLFNFAVLQEPLTELH